MLPGRQVIDGIECQLDELDVFDWEFGNHEIREKGRRNRGASDSLLLDSRKIAECHLR